MEDLEKVIAAWDEGWPKYLALILVAIWGGTASHLSRIKRLGQRFSAAELLGEWAICSFSGVLAMFVCEYYGLNFAATGAFTGIAGHMGGRAVYIVEQLAYSKIPFLKESAEQGDKNEKPRNEG